MSKTCDAVPVSASNLRPRALKSAHVEELALLYKAKDSISRILICGKCGAANKDDAVFCTACGSSLKVSSPPSNAMTATPPSTGSPTSGGAGFDIAGTFKRAIALVTNPISFMKENKDVVPPVNSVMINYVAVLAAIPFIATLIGDLWYYSIAGVAGYAVAAAIVTYILDVAAVFIIGMVIWKLAPTFGTTTDQARATVLSAYMFTPVFLISILNIIPFIGWITFLGLLYGLYILYLGIPILFNTPADKALSYTIGVVIASFIVLGIIYAIVGAISVALFLRGL